MATSENMHIAELSSSRVTGPSQVLSAGLKPQPTWKQPWPPVASFIACSVHLRGDCILLLEPNLTCTINIESFSLGKPGQPFFWRFLPPNKPFPNTSSLLYLGHSIRSWNGLSEPHGDTERPRHIRGSFMPACLIKEQQVTKMSLPLLVGHSKCQT